MSIQVGVHDDGQIRKLAVFLTDLRSFWPLLVPVVTGWWRQQFETEGGFGGERWAPLSSAYAIEKERQYPGRGILVRTGAMRQAASRPRRSVTATSLTLTIDDAKVEYHQQEDGQTGRLPRRPLVFGDPLPATARVELDAVAERYITDLLKRL